MKENVRVASVMVSSHGFREPSYNEQRIVLAEEIAKVCHESGVRVAALPAGFLIAKDDKDISAKRAAQLLSRIFARCDVSIVAGIDLPKARYIKKKGEERRIRKGSLPYFVFAGTRAGRLEGFYRQRCTRSDQDKLLPEVESLEKRIVKLEGIDVALLACGEIHSKKIRRCLVGEDLDLAVDLGHCGLGRGFQVTFPKLAKETDANVINAQHFSKTRSKPSRKWCAPRRGKIYRTKPHWETKLQCGIRAEIVWWDIPKRP
jgi:hypothetical protein